MKPLQKHDIVLSVEITDKFPITRIAEVAACRVWDMEGVERCELVSPLEAMPYSNASLHLGTRSNTPRPQPFLVNDDGELELWLGVRQDDGTMAPIAGPLRVPADWHAAYSTHHGYRLEAWRHRKPGVLARLFNRKAAT